MSAEKRKRKKAELERKWQRVKNYTIWMYKRKQNKNLERQ
jgi:hypothetical protein